MKLAVLGTGMVGRTIAAKLATGGHDIALGTRDPDASLARQPATGTNLRNWLDTNPNIALMRMEEAAIFGDMLIAAMAGEAAVDTFMEIGAETVGNKIIVDLTNPLDFSHGMPPSLFISNTDSLSEAIQRAVPRARVIKTLNTVNANVMVEPEVVGEGDHTMFVAGNDPDARAEIMQFLKTEFGWIDVMDLGDLTAARGMEASLHLWLKLWASIGSLSFSIKVVR